MSQGCSPQWTVAPCVHEQSDETESVAAPQDAQTAGEMRPWRQVAGGQGRPGGKPVIVTMHHHLVRNRGASAALHDEGARRLHPAREAGTPAIDGLDGMRLRRQDLAK